MVTASISAAPMKMAGIPAQRRDPVRAPIERWSTATSHTHSPEFARVLPVSPAMSAHGLKAFTVRYG